MSEHVMTDRGQPDSRLNLRASSSNSSSSAEPQRPLTRA